MELIAFKRSCVVSMCVAEQPVEAVVQLSDTLRGNTVHQLAAVRSKCLDL